MLNITLTYPYLHVEQRLVEFNMFKIVPALAVLIAPSLYLRILVNNLNY